ncbi:MAG: hypothetical protein CL819_08970 [Croceicoccus sp.]|nr:hypothetical protein [Croceicoccus sp.]
MPVRKTDADLETLTAAATCPRAALREGWRRREIMRAVKAHYVFTQRPATVEQIVAATGRSVAFTAARLAGVEGVEVTPEGIYPEGRSVAACLAAPATMIPRSSERQLAA